MQQTFYIKVSPYQGCRGPDIYRKYNDVLNKAIIYTWLIAITLIWCESFVQLQ